MQIGLETILVMVAFFAIQVGIFGIIAYSDLSTVREHWLRGYVTVPNFLKIIWYFGLFLFAAFSSVVVVLASASRAH